MSDCHLAVTNRKHNVLLEERSPIVEDEVICSSVGGREREIELTLFLGREHEVRLLSRSPVLVVGSVANHELNVA